MNDIRFARAPAGGDVFDGFRSREHDLVSLCRVVDVLVDETFLVKLAEDKASSSGVEAEDAQVFVNFALRILLPEAGRRSGSGPG